MASSYTFRDFLARLERGSIAHVRPQYYQNQALFIGRPDMLVRAAGELSYQKGAELLRAARYTQAVPVDAHRAVLAQMLKHNATRQRESLAMGRTPNCSDANGPNGAEAAVGGAPEAASTLSADRYADWRVALELFREAHTTHGNQTPMRVYQSTLRLLGPSRQAAEAVRVLKLRQQVSDVTAPMLVDAAVCHATPERCREALRLLGIAHAAMPSYFMVSGGGDGASGEGHSLAAIGERSLLLAAPSSPQPTAGAGKGSIGSEADSAPAAAATGGRRRAGGRRRGSAAAADGPIDAANPQRRSRAEMLDEIKALEAEEEAALATAAKVRNPFSLMPPERIGDAGEDAEADEAARLLAGGGDEVTADSVAAMLASGAGLAGHSAFTSSAPHSSANRSSLTPQQQASQEANVLLSLVTILEATPWEVARTSPLLMGALEVVVSGGAVPAVALGRERRRLLMERQLVLGAGKGNSIGGANNANALSTGGFSSSSSSSVLTELAEPLPIVEGFAVGYLPPAQGHQMQRDLLPAALANVPWGDALTLLFGAGGSSASAADGSALPSYMASHTSVPWTPALLAAMLAKAPSASEAAKLASLLPPSFMRHRDTAVTMARTQLAAAKRRPAAAASLGGENQSAEGSAPAADFMLTGAEHALQTLLRSSVAAAATSSVTTAGGDASASGGGADGNDSLLASAATTDAARPFPTDLVSSIVLSLWAEGKAGLAVDAANLCMVTRSRLTPAALLAALESAVKVSTDLVKEARAAKAADQRSGSEDVNNSSSSASHFEAMAERRRRSAAMAAVHWKTAVSWALQLQEGAQGDALGLEDRNARSDTTYATYGSNTNGRGVGGGGGGAAMADPANSPTGGYSSVLSEGTSPAASAFVRAATSSLEAAVAVGGSAATSTSASPTTSRYDEGVGSTTDVSFIPERGPPLSSRVLSLLVHLCATQRAPMGALRLIGYAAANGVDSNSRANSGRAGGGDSGRLAHSEEVKALLFCAQYRRPREAALVLTTLEGRLAAAVGLPRGYPIGGTSPSPSGVSAAVEKDSQMEAKADIVRRSMRPLRSLHRALFPPRPPAVAAAVRPSSANLPRTEARAQPAAPAAASTSTASPSTVGKQFSTSPAAASSFTPPKAKTTAAKKKAALSVASAAGTASTAALNDDPFDLFDFGGAVALRDGASAREKWGAATKGAALNAPEEANSREEGDEDDDDGTANHRSDRSL